MLQVILLCIGIVLFLTSWLKSIFQCPPPTIVYRYIPQDPINMQFSDSNKPSDIYNDMFTQSSPWIGGTELGIGKTFSVQKQT